MQHGFAARNGLLGTLLARGGYVGIKKVLEREYGGFLTVSFLVRAVRRRQNID